MKLSDSPAVVAERTVAAGVSDVWDLVVDVSLPARFSGELQSAGWLDGEQPGPGARFAGTNQLGDSTWTTVSTIVTFERHHAFVWAVGDPDDRVATWGFTLESVGPATTRLVMHAQLGTAPSGLTAAVGRDPGREEEIVAYRMDVWKAGMEATLDGIAALAEASAT